MRKTGIPMSSIIQVVLLGMMLLAAGSCAPLAREPTARAGRLGVDEVRALEIRVYEAVNHHRLFLGLKPLRYSDAIAEAARKHSGDMAEGKVPFGHSGFQSRFTTLSEGLPGAAMGENVGVNDHPLGTTAQVAVKKWLESPGHRECMEDAFDVTGVGVAVDSKGTFYYTQIFLRAGGSQDSRADVIAIACLPFKLARIRQLLSLHLHSDRTRPR